MGNKDSETIVTIAAVLVSTLGNFINAIAYILQKKAHTRLAFQNAHLPLNKQKSYVKDCLWLCGLLTYGIGSGLHGIALAFGPQSLLVPLESVTLVANTFLAHKYLQETLRKQDIYGTILVVVGCIFAVVFGPRAEGEIDINDLESGFLNTTFLIFISVVSFIMVVDYIAVKIFEEKNHYLNQRAIHVIQKTFYDKKNDISASREQDDLKNTETFQENDKPLPSKIYKGRTFLMMSYTSIAGYFGSWNQLLTKAFFSLIVLMFSSTANLKRAWMSPITYITLVIFIGDNVLVEYWKQKALSQFGALYVVPIYQVLLIVGGILFGAIYFSELEHLSTLNLCLFVIAVIINLIGVAILASSTGSKEQIKVYNLVRRKLLFQKAIDAFLSLSNIDSISEINRVIINSKINLNKSGSEADPNALGDSLVDPLGYAGERLNIQQFKDPHLLLTGTGAHDMHAMHYISENNADIDVPIGGSNMLGPVIKYVLKTPNNYNIKYRYHNNGRYNKIYTTTTTTTTTNTCTTTMSTTPIANDMSNTPHKYDNKKSPSPYSINTKYKNNDDDEYYDTDGTPNGQYYYQTGTGPLKMIKVPTNSSIQEERSEIDEMLKNEGQNDKKIL